MNVKAPQILIVGETEETGPFEVQLQATFQFAPGFEIKWAHSQRFIDSWGDG